MKTRDSFFDIVKAIGIISIVIGHCWVAANRYVYAYHLVIFFFVAGYFYNRKKYEKDPYLYVSSRLKGSLGKYIFYGVIFILLQPFFIEVGIYAATTVPYTLSDMVAEMTNSIFL